MAKRRLSGRMVWIMAAMLLIEGLEQIKVAPKFLTGTPKALLISSLSPQDLVLQARDCVSICET